MAITELGFYKLMSGFMQLDRLAYQWVHTVHAPWLINIMLVITYMGFSLTYIILAAAVSCYLLYRRQVWEAVFLNISLFSAWGLMGLLKNWFERSRPTGEVLTAAGGYSFPSGHAMLSMAFYGFLASLLLSRSSSKWAPLGAISLYILVFLIGFSRIYLNVHYLSDVLAGFIFGFICLILSLKGMEAVRRRLGGE